MSGNGNTTNGRQSGSDLAHGAASGNGAREQDGLCVTQLAELPAEALLDEQALASRLSVSARTVRRMVGRGQLPPGVKLGGRRIWMAGKVNAFLAAEADRLAAASRRLVIRRNDVGG